MKTLNLSILAMSFALAACGGKDKAQKLADSLTVGGGAQTTQPSQPAPGAGLDGKWDSGCIKNPLGGYRHIEIAVEGAQMEHNVTTFSDEKCERKHADQDGARKGTWSFVKAGIVELRMPIDNNVSALFYFAAARDGESLKIGELGSIDSANETPSIELKNLAPAPAPTPAPAPAPAGALQGGLYKAAAGEKGNDVAISTMEVNGKVSQIWVDFPGKNTPQATLTCEAETCKGSNGQFEYVLVIKSAASFSLSVPAFNVTVNYVKQ